MLKRSSSGRAAAKKVPGYWWDFGNGNVIIVECDDDRFPVLGRFPYDPLLGAGCAEIAIGQARRLIADLEAGRTSPFKIANRQV